MVDVVLVCDGPWLSPPEWWWRNRPEHVSWWASQLREHVGRTDPWALYAVLPTGDDVVYDCTMRGIEVCAERASRVRFMFPQHRRVKWEEPFPATGGAVPLNAPTGW